MYNGWTEPQSKIEARKRRILKGYKPTKRTKKTGGKKAAPKWGHYGNT